MIRMTGKNGAIAAGVLTLSLIAGAGCSDVNSKVAGPGGGPSSGAAGSTSRSGGAEAGTNSFRSEDVNSGGTANSPR
jgi:hypothetical protein